MCSLLITAVHAYEVVFWKVRSGLGPDSYLTWDPKQSALRTFVLVFMK